MTRHIIQVVGPAQEGGIGTTWALDAFGVSTFEKDGSTQNFAVQSTAPDGNPEFTPGEESTRGYTVAENTIVNDGRFATQRNTQTTELLTCLDTNCDVAANTFVEFSNETNRELVVISTYRRITEAEWISAVEQAYETNNVPETTRLPVPMQAACLTGKCPTEDMWALYDPNIAPSPYQEPDGRVKPSVIAGFTVAGFVLFALLGYLCYLQRLKQQARRFRTKFATRVAETIKVGHSARSLAPQALADEFKRIDQENDKFISKEAMREFLDSGKAGEIGDSDFEALWAILDADKSGKVDFLEFCAFMAQCHEEYNAARMDRGSIAQRASTRLSVADISARRLSQRASITTGRGGTATADAAQAIQEIKEEEEDDDQA